jgi:hypothetical protein
LLDQRVQSADQPWQLRGKAGPERRVLEAQPTTLRLVEER